MLNDVGPNLIVPNFYLEYCKNRLKKITLRVDIAKLQKEYKSQFKCMVLLKKLRWGNSITCIKCLSKEVRTVLTDTERYACKNCKMHFSLFTDTIFEGTSLPLPVWFQVIGLMINAKEGISAKEVARNLGITYKTAFYACMRVRIGMLLPESQLNGILEMNANSFSGQIHEDNKWNLDNDPLKSMILIDQGYGMDHVSIIALVQRIGNVRTETAERLTKRHLLSMLKENAKQENPIVITDGFKSFAELESYLDRLKVNNRNEFNGVAPAFYANEEFWAYVKNGIRATYKTVSKKYLPLYLIEFEWKFHMRNLGGNEFENFLKESFFQKIDLKQYKSKTPNEVRGIMLKNKLFLS